MYTGSPPPYCINSEATSLCIPPAAAFATDMLRFFFLRIDRRLPFCHVLSSIAVLCGNVVKLFSSRRGGRRADVLKCLPYACTSHRRDVEFHGRLQPKRDEPSGAAICFVPLRCSLFVSIERSGADRNLASPGTWRGVGQQPHPRCTCPGRHESRANRQLAGGTMAAACSPQASNRTLPCSCRKRRGKALVLAVCGWRVKEEAKEKHKRRKTRSLEFFPLPVFDSWLAFFW